MNLILLLKNIQGMWVRIKASFFITWIYLMNHMALKKNIAIN